MSDKHLSRVAPPPLIPSPRAALVALYARRGALWLLALTVAVGLGLSLASPAFATSANLAAMLADASVTGLAAIGLLLVVLTGGVDLSIGAVAALAPLVASLGPGHLGTPAVLAVTLAAGAGIGAVSGLLVAGGLAAFAVTLVVGAMTQSVAGVLVAAPGRSGGAVALLPGLGMIVPGVPASLALLAVIAALAGTYLAAFRGGRILVAIGSNRQAARAAGLDVVGYGVLPYAVSGGLAALAGLLPAVPPHLVLVAPGSTLTLDALAAVLIGGASLHGGRGSVVSTLLGVALVAMVRSGLSLLGVASLWQGCAVGALILAGLAADRLARLRRPPL